MLHGGLWRCGAVFEDRIGFIPEERNAANLAGGRVPAMTDDTTPAATGAERRKSNAVSRHRAQRLRQEMHIGGGGAKGHAFRRPSRQVRSRPRFCCIDARDDLADINGFAAIAVIFRAKLLQALLGCVRRQGLVAILVMQNQPHFETRVGAGDVDAALLAEI